MPKRRSVCLKCEQWFSTLAGSLAARDEYQSDCQDDQEVLFDSGLNDLDESIEEPKASTKQGPGITKKKCLIHKTKQKKIVKGGTNCGKFLHRAKRMSKQYDLLKEDQEEEDGQDNEQFLSNPNDRNYAKDR